MIESAAAAELLRELVAEQRATRAEVRALRLAIEGKAYRDRLLVELADAVALGPTWAGAQAVALILAGARDAPAGAESVAELLRAAGPLSARQVLRILQTHAARLAADKTAALCQWPPSRYGSGIATDDEEGSNDE